MSATPPMSWQHAQVVTGPSLADATDPLSWVAYATRLVVADYVLRGHPYCVGYAISSWPESVLPEAHWSYFESLPATSPGLSMMVLRLPSHHRVYVRSASVVTVADVLRALYGARANFPSYRLLGLSYAGLDNFFNVHLDM